MSSYGSISHEDVDCKKNWRTVQPSVRLCSPVPHIIGRNSLPTKDDATSIHNTIRESRTGLSEVRDELARMEADLGSVSVVKWQQGLGRYTICW